MQTLLANFFVLVFYWRMQVFNRVKERRTLIGISIAISMLSDDTHYFATMAVCVCAIYNGNELSLHDNKIIISVSFFIG